MHAPIRLALAIVSLATTFHAQASLDGDLSLLQGMLVPIEGTIPAGAKVGVSLDVSGGPAGGQAFYAFAGGTIAPLATPFGDLLLDPGTLATLGVVTIEPAGVASVFSSYATPLAAFQLAFQVATVDVGAGTVELTSAVVLGHGTNLLKSCKGNVIYNLGAQSWKSVVTSRLVVPQTIDVEWFDASSGSTSTLTTGTVPGGSVSTEGFLFQSGTVDLDSGDRLTIRCAGSDIGSIDV